MRKIVAFIIAPLATMIGALIDPSSWGFFAFLTLFYSYPLALLVGVPAFLHFRRKGWLKLWQVLAAGATVGLAIPLLITLSFGPDALLKQATSAANPPKHLLVVFVLPAIGAAIGAAVALIFWIIAYASLSGKNHNQPPQAAA